MLKIRTITRTLSADSLRRVCIRQEWCDAMTNEKYAELFDLLPEHGSVSDKTLLRVSEAIVDGTDRYRNNPDYTRSELVENVLYGLLSDGCRFFPVVDDDEEE